MRFNLNEGDIEKALNLTSSKRTNPQKARKRLRKILSGFKKDLETLTEIKLYEGVIGQDLALDLITYLQKNVNYEAENIFNLYKRERKIAKKLGFRNSYTLDRFISKYEWPESLSKRLT